MAAGSRGDPPQHVKPTTSQCVSNKPFLSIVVFFLTDLSLLHPEVWAAHITVAFPVAEVLSSTNLLYLKV
jgi:hypothetical protein